MNFEEYLKTKEHLICVDSDGCVMDTMNSKHIKCFGPAFFKIFAPYENEQRVLDVWNKINLYSETRGINRFKGCARALIELEISVEGKDEFIEFTNNSKELSNKSLARQIEKSPNPCLKKALQWSEATNILIDSIFDESKPFENAPNALSSIKKLCDVACVSSANKKALEEEWEKHGLAKHTNIVLSQEAGSKAYCIETLQKKGYKNNYILMIGDAPGDLDAAIKNKVWFYPILADRENESWELLVEKYLPLFVQNQFSVDIQRDLIEKFKKNLNDNSFK